MQEEFRKPGSRMGQKLDHPLMLAVKEVAEHWMSSESYFATTRGLGLEEPNTPGESLRL